MNNRRILELLENAESALRENLHRHDLEPTARAHMERAANHVREAYVATNEQGKARTVRRLVGDLEKVDRLMEKVSQRQTVNVKSIHI